MWTSPATCTPHGIGQYGARIVPRLLRMRLINCPLGRVVTADEGQTWNEAECRRVVPDCLGFGGAEG